MRRFIFGMVMVVLSLSWVSAAAIEQCQWKSSGEHLVEWLEQGALRGARIVSHDANWKLDGLGWHATSVVYCANCADGRGLSATLWLGASDPKKRDLDGIVGVETLAARMWPFPYRVSGAEFRPKSEILSISMGDLEGRARIHQIKTQKGETAEVIAFAAAKDCILLYAILAEGKGDQISADRLEDFASAIAVEQYTPPQPPPGWNSIDTRRKWLDEHRKWLDEQLRSGVLNQGKQ
jgi:hypothetical protein